MRSRDAQRPWVVDTRELVRRPGTMRRLDRVVAAPDALGTDVVAIAAGQPVRFEGRIESVVEGVLVSGSVRAVATGECVRCLDDVAVEVDADLLELFAYPDRAAHHHEVGADADDDQEQVLEDDAMDLEDVVRDAVVTALPFRPVCRDDCPGLCPECGARLVEDPQHQHDVIDPRWSALAGLAQAPGPDDEKRN